MYAPKIGARDEIALLLKAIIERGKLTSGEAAHIRGVLGWFDTAVAGRPLRGAMSAFVARQYYETTTDITTNLLLAIQYCLAVLAVLPDVSLQLMSRISPPVVIYTDASADGDRVRLGGVLFEQGRKPAVWIYDVTDRMRPLLGDKKTVINQAELLA